MNKLDIIRGKIIYAESNEDGEEIIKIFTDMGAVNEYGYTPLPGMGYFISTKNQIFPTVEVGVSLKEFKELLKHIEYPKIMLVSDHTSPKGKIINGLKREVLAANENGYFAFAPNKEEVVQWRYAEEITEESKANRAEILSMRFEVSNLKYRINELENQLKQIDQ